MVDKFLAGRAKGKLISGSHTIYYKLQLDRVMINKHVLINDV